MSRLQNPRGFGPRSRVTAAFIALAGLWLHVLAATSPATEFGVYWGNHGPSRITDPLAAALANAGVNWTRGSGLAPGLTEKTVVPWWPGAIAIRDPEAPDLTRWHQTTNLWAVYWAAKTNSLAHHPSVTAVEIGNEPDLHFTPDLPDRMAAILKAAWWGLKSERPDLPVLMPSLAAAPGPYARQLVANRIIPYTDGWNCHFYGWAQDFGGNAARHRQFADRHGGRHLPLWLTEYGFADLPALPAPPAPIELARQRTFFESATLEGAALGITRQMAFSLSPHTEGGLDLGLLADDGQPRPAFSAWLELVRRLRVAQPLYRLRHVELDQTVGWVWRLPAVAEEPETWWTVLQSPHRRTDFNLPPLVGRAKADQPSPAPWTSFFEFQLRFPAGSAPVSVGLSGEYGPWREPILHFNASAATNLHLVTPPRRFEVAGCRWEPVVPPTRRHTTTRTPPGPVIATLIPLGPGVSVDKTAVTYRYASTDALTLEVRLHNFSAAPVQGRWWLSLPDGWQWSQGQATEGTLPLAALSDRAMVLTVRPPRNAPQRPAFLRLHWRDARGIRDKAEIQLRPALVDPGAGTPLPARWQSAQPETRWLESEPSTNQTFRLGNAAGSGDESLLLGLPANALRSADTLLRFGIRLGAGQPARRSRVELVTPRREVFRWGEDALQADRWQIIQARVGDFTPGFWSHVGPGDPKVARYLRISLLGLAPGESVELTPVTVIRPGR